MVSDPEVLVTICARGGSKGVVDKHIRPLCDKPLLNWTLEQAIAWGKGPIIVSSDSHRILWLVASWNRQNQVVALKRPSELAEDDTPKVPVIRHALIEAERIFNKQFDIIVDLDATAPLRTVADIEGCYQKFLDVKPMTLFSVTHGPNPRFNMVEWKEDGTLNLCMPEDYWKKGVRHRQGMREDVYCVNSNIYIYSRNFLVDETFDSCLVPDGTAIYLMHKRSLMHIDSEQDFQVVEEIMRGMEGEV